MNVNIKPQFAPHAEPTDFASASSTKSGISDNTNAMVMSGFGFDSPDAQAPP